MKRICSTILMFIFSCVGLIACSFELITFCETSTIFSMNTIVAGEIISVDTDGIDLEVINVLKGEENRNTIRIWDGTDYYCLGFISMAASDLGEIGDSIVVILPRIDSIENEWDRIGDYRRPKYLGYTSKLKYNEFINSPDIYEDCTELSVATKEIKNNNGVNYTNPVQSILRINFESVFNRIIEIYTLQGVKLVTKVEKGDKIEIDLSSHQKGIYFISIRENDIRYKTLKVVKM